MMDLKSLFIISTAIILTIVVAGMAVLNAGSVTGAAAKVLQVHNHKVILVELNVRGADTLRKVEVNGVTVWKGGLLVTSSANTLLIESIGSVKLFHNEAEALGYLQSPASGVYPGRPLPNAQEYLVKLYFDSGVVTLRVTG